MLGPIFVREWSTLPRRASHYVVRTSYLGLLAVLGVTVWQLLIGWGRPASLGTIARFGQLLFQVLAYAQLTFLLFFSALKGVSAVAEEKDRRTFLLLLLTDLRNREIVLGKLAGALLPTLLLLLGSVPILALLLLLGGVGPEQVPQVVLIQAASCVAVGSFGGLMALWREQTFPALALTFLGVILYLCGVRALDLFADVPQAQQWLDPYLALGAVLDPPSAVPPLPAFVGFALTMFGLSVALNVVGIVRLRVWNPRGEPAQQRERPEDDEEEQKERRRPVPATSRLVWPNPILWREIRTRAYGRRSSLIKIGYLLAFALIVASARAQDQPNHREAFAAASGLVPTMILSLLLIAAQAVTAVTRERDLRSLDLLLATDLTPHEFIFGKLVGIAFNSLAYLLPPLFLTGYYAVLGMLAAPLPRGGIDVSQNVQALIGVIGTQLVLAAFTMVLGLHVGLRIEDSRTAVVHVLGAVFFLTAGTLLCIGLIVVSGRFEYQWGSFVIFLGAGIGGLWWVLNGEWSSTALIIASWLCPLGLLYAVMNVLIGKPGTEEASSPWLPFLAIVVPFGFAIRAMLTPLLSEFDLALGRTHRGN